ncbi:sensor histidine kinase [Paenibacillus sp. NEAU-GSW1]|uniref:sensor histidine kinase n=1 Tax=Paenibacillus sp. NEAU-GSW1 TaxID=2682486 RepID=UPI0012E16B25|nr:sensor histidine kinase [Paenibacillus sp. NEAU-GSW1]MUT67217.1 HAMP domain-containing protein [Paenibacillus sp. NEAU-GSW1]
MTIRTKLLLFIPLLVLLTNGVTFFLFESSKSVQKNYGQTMDRMLLYTQSAQSSDALLRVLYTYLLNPGSSSESQLLEQDKKLRELGLKLSKQRGTLIRGAELEGYIHMLDTLAEQQLAARQAAAATPPQPGEALRHYEKAEQTASFIRDEERRLLDAELTAYEPLYRSIQLHLAKLDWLGPTAFIVNTMLSIALALWISRSITAPVAKLVETAKRIAKGDWNGAHANAAADGKANDELGILSETFRHMLADLNELIGKDKQRMESEKLIKELELQALQSQINPHFLFNTLNVLSRLAVIEGADRTSDLIVTLSGLIRYNLQRLEQPVTIREELEHVRKYIAIQQARFRDRVHVELNAEEGALDLLIPALTLQPLVENAYMHGVEGMERGGEIQISILALQGGAAITIIDNGCGMSAETREALLSVEEAPMPAKSASAGTGIGTRNVFKRLRLFYNRDDIIEIESSLGQGTVITLHVPRKVIGQDRLELNFEIKKSL